MLTGLLALAWLASPVDVGGDALCPSPEAVAARLDPLLPAVRSGGARDRARLSVEGEELVIVLEAPGGEVLGVRRLPRHYPCADLAAAAAVALAAWETDVHPEFRQQLQARAVGSAAAVTSPASPGAPAPPPRWTMGAGAALGVAGGADSQVTAAGDLTALGWLKPPGARTSVRAELTGQTAREIGFPDGRATWRRVILGVGLDRPFAWWGTPAGDGVGDRALHAFALARAAWLDLRGLGFEVNHADGAFDPGLEVGVRAALARAWWSAWISAGAAWWPIRHELVTRGSADVAALPSFEICGQIGVDFGRR